MFTSLERSLRISTSRTSFRRFQENCLCSLGAEAIGSLEVPGVPFLPLLERLIDLTPDADTYFASLAKLHKTRLKYERILNTQPIPTMEQVGAEGTP